MGNRRLHPDYRPGNGERERAGDGPEVGGAAGRVGAWPHLTDGPALCCVAEAKRPPRPPAINTGERAARPPAAGVGSPAAGAPASAPGRRDLDERGPALREDAARADRAAAVREPRGGGVRAGHLPLDRCLQVSGAPATAGDTPPPADPRNPEPLLGCGDATDFLQREVLLILRPLYPEILRNSPGRPTAPKPTASPKS